MITRTLHLVAFSLALLLAGCGGGKGTPNGGSMAGTEHDKLMNEACELSMKIMAEREAGKGVDEVNQQFAQQITDIDARIAKLPKMTEQENFKIIGSAKTREVLDKWGALAEKGQLHDTGKLLKFPDYTLEKATETK